MATEVSTIRQLRSFRPTEGQEPDFLLPDGGKYYGQCHPLRKVPHGRGVAFFGDGSKYGGDWYDGHQHGKGTIVAASYEFEGELDNDRMHGQGFVRYKETLVGFVTRGINTVTPGETAAKPLEYTGELHRDFHRHGKGKMKYRNGDSYDGEWHSNVRHGTGSLTCDDGERYVGEFMNDVRCGQGTVSYPNGQVFTGTMEQDKRIGMGCLVFPNGDEYCGNFSNDHIAGQGTMRYKNGDLYDGQWKDGLRHGKGKFTLKKSGAAVSGNFYKGLIHGKGSVELPGKSFFVGEFDKGERLNGTLWLNDGSCYWGGWRGDVMHGKGIMWYANGDSYYGMWANSVRNGAGNINYADGSEYSGDFLDGKRHGTGILVSTCGSKISAGVWKDDELTTGYKGEWDGRTYSGRGKMTLVDGTSYDGLWLAGVRSFFGVERFKDGLQYIGAWRRDKPEGMGFLHYGEAKGGNIIIPASEAANFAQAAALKNNSLSKGATSSNTIVGSVFDDKGKPLPTLHLQGELFHGELVGGRRDGTGICINPTTGRMFSGHYSNDVQWGNGVLYEVDMSVPIFEKVEKPTTEKVEEISDDSATADGSSLAKSASSTKGKDDLKKSTSSSAKLNKKESSGGLFSFFFGGKKNAADEKEQEQLRIIGYQPAFICEGTWINHKQSGKGRVYFPDGRVFQGSWLNGKLRVEMPHRGNIIENTAPSNGGGGGGGPAGARRSSLISSSSGSPALPPPCTPGTPSARLFGSPTTCPFCNNEYGFFRKQTTCILCSRSLCMSCLKETSNFGNVGVAIDSATAAAKMPSGTVVPQATSSATAKGAGSPTTHLADSLSAEKTHHADVDASIFAAASKNSIMACSDCFQCVQLRLHRGTMWDATGTIAYRGFIAADQPHGDGSLWNSDSSFFHGTFHLGKRQGYGRLAHSNGDEFCGNWKNDTMDGAGYYRTATGVVFQGDWCDGKLTKLRYHGEMNGSEGIREGSGIAYLDDGARYNGQWSRNKFNGLGILKQGMDDGRIYSGEFHNGTMQGKGKLVSPGSVFTGMMENGLRCGMGTERCGDLTTTGNWKNDLLEGTVSIFNRLDGSETLVAYSNGEERQDVFVPGKQQADSSTSSCRACNAAFSLFNRKHHCRLCGHIFDHACSKKKITLPAHFNHGTEPKRVCNQCFAGVTDGQTLRIKYLKDGTILALTVSKGEWKGLGMKRDVSGDVYISTNDRGFSAMEPASDQEIREFASYWETLTVCCGITSMELIDLMQPNRGPITLPKIPQVLFDDADLGAVLFEPDNEAAPRELVPVVIPPPPAKPAPHASNFLSDPSSGLDSIRPQVPTAEALERQMQQIRDINDAAFGVKKVEQPIRQPGFQDDLAGTKTPSGNSPTQPQPSAPSGNFDSDPFQGSDSAVVKPSGGGGATAGVASAPPPERSAPTTPTGVTPVVDVIEPNINFRGILNQAVPPRPPKRKPVEGLTWDSWKTAPCPVYNPTLNINAKPATNEGTESPAILSTFTNLVGFGGSDAAKTPPPKGSTPSTVKDESGADSPNAAARSAPPSNIPKVDVAEAERLLANVSDFIGIRSVPAISETEPLPVGTMQLTRLEGPIHISVEVDRSGPKVTQEEAVQYVASQIPKEDEASPQQQHNVSATNQTEVEDSSSAIPPPGPSEQNVATQNPPSSSHQHVVLQNESPRIADIRGDSVPTMIVTPIPPSRQAMTTNEVFSPEGVAAAPGGTQSMLSPQPFELGATEDASPPQAAAAPFHNDEAAADAPDTDDVACAPTADDIASTPPTSVPTSASSHVDPTAANPGALPPPSLIDNDAAMPSANTNSSSGTNVEGTDFFS